MPENTYQILEHETEFKDSFCVTTKFRGINPWVKVNTRTYKRLTECDEDFKKEFYGRQYQHEKKFIKFINGYSLLGSLLGKIEGH